MVTTVLGMLGVAALVVLGVAFVPRVPRVWRRWREQRVVRRSERSPPTRRTAADNDRIAEAMEIRERIATYAQRKNFGFDAALTTEVDLLIESMVAIAQMRRELEADLRGIGDRLARDAELLDQGVVDAQRHQIYSLRIRARSLETELARAVAGLRETWLGLLEAMNRTDSGNLATTRTHEQVESLRIWIQAEREAHVDVRHGA